MACESLDESKVRSEFVTKVLDPPEDLDYTFEYATAREFAVPFPVEDSVKFDLFIDALISIAVDLGRNLDRKISAPCTIIYAIVHSCAG